MMIHHNFTFSRKSYCDEFKLWVTFYYRLEGFFGKYEKSAK
ncbi:putative jacalin lectin family protein [Listeria monocytogenes FSL F2-208]|nr:putative jacalin lectin family protein [Listeria monocytogenes FSL F2-208]